MAHLFPDMTVKQYDGSEDFIFAAPIAKAEWDAMHHHSYITEDKKYRWIRREFHQFKPEANSPPFITIILRQPHHSDNQMLEAAAWLRITLECLAWFCGATLRRARTGGRIPRSYRQDSFQFV